MRQFLLLTSGYKKLASFVLSATQRAGTQWTVQRGEQLQNLHAESASP